MDQRKFRVAVLVVSVLALLAGSFLAGRHASNQRLLRTQTESAFAAPESPEFSAFGCTNVNNVAVFENRIHVKCSSVNVIGTNNVYYYAYPTNGTSGYTANRLLAIAHTAFVLNKSVWIYYQANTSYNPPSCNTGDCRLLVGLSVVE